MNKATIWTEGDRIHLSFGSHSVCLRADEVGVVAALRILRQREHHVASPTIGQPGAQTQAQLDELIRALTRKAPPAPERAVDLLAERRAADSFLEELGL